MDILIKNMGLPKEGFIRLMIYSDGTVREINPYNEAVMPTEATAVALPEHGRLCDLDALIEHETYNIEQALFDTDEVLEDLKNTPVIVEANNGTDN